MPAGAGYFDNLLAHACKCGITPAEYWAQTPKETFLSIDSYIWRTDQQTRLLASAAWLNANLSRARRMPTLKSLFASKKARKLEGQELQKRRAEFEEMTSAAGLDKIKGFSHD